MNKITRRAFIEGAGTTVLASASAHAQEQPTGPHFVRDGAACAVWWSDEKIFSLKPADIAPGSEVVLTHNKLTMVRLTGTDPRSVDFLIEGAGEKWTIQAVWQFAKVLKLKSDPVSVPKSPGYAEFRVALKPGELASLVHNHLSGGQIQCPSQAKLLFDTASQETVVAAEGGQLFSAFSKRLYAHSLLLAPLTEGMSVQLTNDQPSAEIDIAKDKQLQLKLRVAKEVTAGFGPSGRLSLEGPAELLIDSPHCETTRIPAQSASRMASAGGESWTLRPTGDFWRLNIPRTSFEAKVEGDSTGQPSLRPIEVSVHGGKPTHFCVHACLMSTTLALKDVDRTRFDLAGALLRLLYVSPPASKIKVPAYIRPTPAFAYTTPDAALRIALPDGAKLRLWRGQDLFNLTFQFHHIDLTIDNNVELIPLPYREMNPANGPHEAVLLAEFPPQHIMERTFNRQDRPLPDAGEEISLAVLRELQRLQAAGSRQTGTNANKPSADNDYQCLRQSIQDHKKSAERCDIAGEDCPKQTGDIASEDCKAQTGAPPQNGLPNDDNSDFPFAAFADAWDAKHGDKFGKWIGPAGLFTIEARRTARLFAEERRLSRLKALTDKPKFDQKDFREASEILARPAFPMSSTEVADWLAQKNPKAKPDAKSDFSWSNLGDLWTEASLRSEDFATFEDFEHTKKWLLLPDWPFSKTEMESICNKANLKLTGSPPSEDEAQKELVARLKKLLASQSDTLRKGDDPKVVTEGFRRPVEAWLAGPSRLAFAIGPESLPLTVEKLTAWESFELRVVQRAQRMYTDRRNLIEESKPEKILKDQGIVIGKKDDAKTGEERVSEIVSLVKEPEQFETALEIPTGLILSPAQDARWITPKGLPGRLECSPGGTVKVAVWQARLVERQKLSSLRAVWSKDFDVFSRDTFLKNATPDDQTLLDTWKAPDGNSYSTAMTPRDQAELVALTSMYGLPVISSTNKGAASQIAPPDNYLTGADADTAIYMPVPLQARRLALGATGAMLDLDTTFPLVTAASATAKRNDPYFKSFSLQRWRSLISDGSDVITTVVRRGYLFPLGHKASLVSVTEPRLRPIDPQRPSLGYSVEQATHTYIEVTRASHQYPAVAQSFEARDFQPRNITLLTLRTPDLVKPTDDQPLPDRMPLPGTQEDTPQNRLKAAHELLLMPLTAAPHGRIRGWVDRKTSGADPQPGQIAGTVFWPRTEIGTEGTVRFRMRIDGQPTPVSMPLIFADHTAASDPPTLKAMTTYYQGHAADGQDQDARQDADKPKNWNKVLHNGAPRTYADEQRKGQCTYVTDWQLLEAVGGDSHFAFNPELVADEQPPFYPRLARAQIRPQQIQGLNGSAAPVLQVEYDQSYVYNGFNPPQSCNIADPETFLRVTNNPLPKFDMGDHGDQAGTIARPAKVIGGLNRRFGIAGPYVPSSKDCSAVSDQSASNTQAAGQKSQPSQGAATPSQLPEIAPPPAAAPAVCSSASQPRRFDSKELALGHFGDNATLFGLIKLRDFLAAVSGDLGANIPLLEEITNFTGKQLAAVAGELKGAVSELVKHFDDNGGSVLFPDFSCALGSLSAELDRLTKAKAGPDDTLEQIEAATAIWSSGQRVVRELEAIARTSVSQFAERVRTYLIASQQDIANKFLAFAPWNDIQKQLTQLVINAAKQLPDAVVTIADTGAKAEELAAFTKRLVDALGKPETWTSPDVEPLDAIAKGVSQLPNHIGLAKGPLYELATSLVSLTQQNLAGLFDQTSLASALNWAVGAIDEAEGVQRQIDDLIKLDTGACARAIGSLRALFDAVVDSSTNRAKSVVDNINKQIETIDNTYRALDGKVGDLKNDAAVKSMMNYLQDWIARLKKLSGDIDKTIKDTQANAKRALGTLPTAAGLTASLPDILANVLSPAVSPLVCSQFDAKTIPAAASLAGDYKELIRGRLDFAAAIPQSPPPLPKVGVNTLLPYWQDVQKQLVAFVQSAMLDADAIAQSYASANGAKAWNAAKESLGKLAESLPAEAQAALRAALKSQDNAVGSLQTTRSILNAAVQGYASAAAPDLAAVYATINAANTVYRKSLEDLFEAETNLFNATLRAAMRRLLAELNLDLNKAAAEILKPIANIYEAIKTQRDKAYHAVQDRLGADQNQANGVFDLIKKFFEKPKADPKEACIEDWEKYILLVPLADGTCTDEKNDALAIETDELQKKKTAEDLKGVLEKWKSGECAPLRILKHIEYFAGVGIRSQITRVLDVESLRQKIIDSLANALPTTRTLKSSLSLPLHETSVGIGTFRPLDNDPHLTLNGIATVHLLDPVVPQTQVDGNVPRFELDILSIMTFTFRQGVTYKKGINDGRGNITAPLGAEDIKFGDKLSFLADLSSYFSFGDKGSNGAYTIVHTDSPSIEAGYRIGIPVITLGVTFTNINFAGSVVLPFTNGSARLRAALGSLDNPFMISAGIYGGSGFMALEASPQGIEAFEASFEFGGIASLGYGPLQGTAYVTTGAYVRKDQLGCTFAALFSAGFTAHIACFGVSASFTLRLYKRTGDSSVSGEAQLTFTFSIGRFIKISYTIRVARSMQAGFGGGGKEAAFNILPGGGVQIAALDGFAPECFPLVQAAVLQITSLSPEETWSAFEAQFDPDFVPEALK